MVTSMVGCAQPMALSFPFERPVFMKEHTNGLYDVVPYFLSKFFVEIPVVMCQTLLGVSISYLLMALQSQFLMLWTANFLLGIASASIAIMLGCIANRVSDAVELFPLAFIPQLVLGGFLIQMDQVPKFLRWVKWICPLKMAGNLCLLTEFREDTPANNQTLSDNSVTRGKEWLYATILIVMIVVFRTTGALILKRKAAHFM